ncbi:MAG: YdcF family protein [Alphaproteobacteria bacterium]|nr:YdcF family protein [Alphaproteobacteria bacterium]
MSFAISKILWCFLEPGDLFLIGLGIAVVSAWLWPIKSRYVVTGLAVIALIVAFLPFSEAFIGSLENRFPQPSVLPAEVDGIIVLGGFANPEIMAARGQPTLNQDAGRLIAFIELAHRYPKAKLVFTGGSGALLRQDLKEAPVVRALMEQVGFDSHRVIFENESRNTYENAIMSKALVQPAPGSRWVLVTSAWHMPRSVGVFRAAGWPIIPYPVSYNTPSHLERLQFRLGLDLAGIVLHEFVGMIAYRLMGRTDVFFPAPQE